MGWSMACKQEIKKEKPHPFFNISLFNLSLSGVRETAVNSMRLFFQQAIATPTSGGNPRLWATLQTLDTSLHCSHNNYYKLLTIVNPLLVDLECVLIIHCFQSCSLYLRLFSELFLRLLLYLQKYQCTNAQIHYDGCLPIGRQIPSYGQQSLALLVHNYCKEIRAP